MLAGQAAAYSALTILAFLALVPGQQKDPSRIGVWQDIDRVFVALARRSANVLCAPVAQIDQAAQQERIFAGRIAVSGLLLLSILPFHRWFFTDGAIDVVWKAADAASQIATAVGFKDLVHIPKDWRGQEYYLWELAAFVWTVLQFGLSHMREINHLLEAKLMEGTTAFRSGMLYLVAAAIVAITGFFVLLSASSIYVLLFETAVVCAITAMELILARLFFKGAKANHATRGVQSALFIEIPAALAFFLASLFILTAEGLTSYNSHWSHAFAAGAAALDLVLANVGLLMIRVFQHPAETTVNATA